MNENSTKQTTTNTIPNNCIWYESANGEIVEPHDCSSFDANIVSNTYKDGKGVIAFDKDITRIDGFAFCRCTGLTSVTIGNSVTSIGGDAFNGCTRLTNITIPYGVTKIGALAFRGCAGLTSVTIPDSVVFIGWYAFRGCVGLKNIYCKRATPPTISPDAFDNIAPDAQIYVPRASDIAYQSNKCWKNYVSKIVDCDF